MLTPLTGIGSVYPYYEQFKVRRFETVLDGNISLPILWRYMQEVATNHLEYLHIGYHVLVEHGVVFLLTDVSLKVHRFPQSHEEIIVATCPAGVKGTRMLREVVVLSTDMELLCEFQTAWAPVNPSTHKLLRPSAFPFTLPTLEQYTPFCDVSRYRLTGGTEVVGTRQIGVSDLDRNHHLNNTVYLSIIADAIGEEYLNLDIEEVHIKYKGEGKYGETMTLKRSDTENGILISGHFDDRVCFYSEIITRK